MSDLEREERYRRIEADVQAWRLHRLTRTPPTETPEPTPGEAAARQTTTDLLAALKGLLAQVEDNTCQHVHTHRGGAIWTICDDCGKAWADDRGGKPEFVWPAVVEAARALIAKAEGRD